LRLPLKVSQLPIAPNGRRIEFTREPGEKGEAGELPGKIAERDARPGKISPVPVAQSYR